MKKNSRRPSIQTRIAVFYFLSFFTVFIAIIAVLYFYWASVFNREINQHFLRRAQLVGHIWLEETQKGERGLKERMDNDIAAAEMRVAIFSVGGRLLYSRNMPHVSDFLSRKIRDEISDRGPVIQTIRENGVIYREIRTSFKTGNRMDGFVFKKFPLHVLSGVEKTFLKLIPGIAAGLFGMAFLLSMVLNRGIIRAIDAITDATYRVNAERFDNRVETTKLDVEFLPLAENFNRMCARLGKSFDSLRRFTSDASHELRTPLTIIKSNLEVTLQKDRTSEEYVETISDALDAVNRLSRMVNTLLMMVRAETGEAAFNKTDLDLSHIVREVVDFISPIAEDKGINMQLDLVKPVNVKGDEEWLRHVVFNLLDNSIKYCHTSDTIRVALTNGAGECKLKISDTGPGIPAEHLPRVFDRFYRTPNANGVTGSGLGLALCKWVVSGHNGEISSTSEPGAGATFIISIPSNS